MTARTLGRTAALLVAGSLLIAACDSGAASNAPITPVPITPAPITQAPAETSQPDFSFVIPSFHSDVDLESLVPKQIGGETVIVQSMTGEEFLGGGSSEEMTAALASLGKQPSDMTVAFGFTTGDTASVSIIAIRVKGVTGSALYQAIVDAYKSSGGTTVTDASFGGKSVKKSVPADGSGTSYIYSHDDVLFAVGGETVTDAILNEVFSKLP